MILGTKGFAVARSNEEEKLHRAVWQYLRYALPSVLAFHPASGGARDIIEGARMKAFGAIRGIPDLLLFFGTAEQPKFGAIELKSAKGRLSDHQVGFKEQWEKRGGKYAVCRTLEEVESALRAWGLKPGCARPAVAERSERLMQQNAYHQIMMDITKEDKDL